MKRVRRWVESVIPPECLKGSKAISVWIGRLLKNRYADILDRALAGHGRFIAGAEQKPPGTAVARLALRGEHPDILMSGAPTYIRLSEAEIKYPKGNPGGFVPRC